MTVNDLAFRMVSIAVRKYSNEPDNRSSAAGLLLSNALRLALMHLPRERVAKTVLAVLEEENQGRGRAA